MNWSFKIILAIIIMCFTYDNIACAQSNEKLIVLTKINTLEEDEYTDKNRNIEYLSYLPQVVYCNKEKAITLTAVTNIEDIRYYIKTEHGDILIEEILTLIKDEEVTLSTATLPCGIHTIVLGIDNNYYEGDFEIVAP